MSKRSLMLSKLVVALCLLACFAPTPAISRPAQQKAASSDLDAKYKNKLVMLRQSSCDQRLEFDQVGRMVSAVPSGKCKGLRIRSVSVEDGTVTVAAERVLLAYDCRRGETREVGQEPGAAEQAQGDNEIVKGREVSIKIKLPLFADQAMIMGLMDKIFLSDAADGNALHVGYGVSAPIPIYSPDPDYAEGARKANFEGTVTLVVTVGVDGLVHNARVSRSLGMGLDEKAIEKVKTWRFKPATRCGNPVAVEVSIEIKFQLYHRAPEQPSPTSNIFGDPRTGSPAKSAFAFR